MRPARKKIISDLSAHEQNPFDIAACAEMKNFEIAA
jgi:hypothetical protein